MYTDDQIKKMRQRLYERGAGLDGVKKHQLKDEPIEVSREWNLPAKQKTATGETTDLRRDLKMAENNPSVAAVKPRSRYRRFVIVSSFFILAVVALLSSLYVMFGGNQISGDKIEVSINGPALIGGGEEVALEVLVTNNNPAPLESAILIMKYPPGTMTVGDSPRVLSEEKIPLNKLNPGELQTVPLKVAIFGEENTEKKITAQVEYRLAESNGTFTKEASPLAIKISSSPLVLRVDNIEKVASGQTVEVVLTVASNAPTPLENILVTASYPSGFSFVSSEPAPIYGENVWSVGRIEPEGEAKIKITGIAKGLTDETFRINFAAGPAQPDNPYGIAASLADNYADFLIERPFIDVDVAIDGKGSREIVLPEGKEAGVNISLTNTLEESVYDLVVEVVPQGNAITPDSIKSSNGFYDSNTGTVRWEVSNNEDFATVVPGDKRKLSFTVVPGPEHKEAYFELTVNVYARRVSETSAQETLIGTAKTGAKYSGSVLVLSQAGRNTAGFADYGPIPPKVGESTSYTLTLAVEAGVNDVTDAVLETGLPIYVNWLNKYEAEAGKVIYNSVAKKLRWEIGDIPAGQRKVLNLQVDLKPSLSQVEKKPVLLNSQKIKANDRFTGALLQDTAEAVTTELSRELGFPYENGKVRK